MTNETFRCFVALPLSEEAKASLASFVAAAKPSFPDYRFGSAENLHITLQFLGEVPRIMSQTIADSLSRSCRAMISFQVGCGEAGSFPDKGLPRILHVAVTEGTDELLSVARSVRGTLNQLGFSDAKPFTPHITLGRGRDMQRRQPGTQDSSNIRSAWKDSYRRFLEENLRQVTWDISEVLLMESVLGPNGPRYTRVAGPVFHTSSCR